MSEPLASESDATDSIGTEKSPTNPEKPHDNEDALKSVYRKVLKFYKENAGKSVSLPYQAKLMLVAYTQQVVHGPCSQANVEPVGAFDVIGKDRRNAWLALGEMTKDEAMRQFIAQVEELMPMVKPFLEAQQQAEEKEIEEMQQKRLEQETLDERQKATLEAERLAHLERQRQEDQRRQIQDALNKQTFTQFRAYAEQQYPNNPDQQAVLIRQLQEQHYYQYMQQIYQQQMENHVSSTMAAANGVSAGDGTPTNDTASTDTANKDDIQYRQHHAHRPQQLHGESVHPLMDTPDVALVNGMNTMRLGPSGDYSDGPESDHDSQGRQEDDEEGPCGEDCGYCEDQEVEEVPPASMWTKKELTEFKDCIRTDGGDGIIKVGHGETVTIRVPTAEDGTALFWEFATDSYDIAFGVFFEWNKTDETEVSIHVSDSEDEDLDDEYLDENGDPETGSTAALVDKGPPTSVVVPIFRRDCHKEVYAGTHPYPAQGVYLLKFDNTYSLWRSKTLYYRVYYTK